MAVTKKTFKRGTVLIYLGGGRGTKFRKGTLVVAGKAMNGGTRYWVRGKGITTQISSKFLKKKTNTTFLKKKTNTRQPISRKRRIRYITLKIPTSPI